ncbi:MAG: hypothetical protein PVJ04_17570, partial [Gemmatimonadota bacterium]
GQQEKRGVKQESTESRGRSGRLPVSLVLMPMLLLVACGPSDEESALERHAVADYALVISTDRGGGTMDLFLHARDSDDAEMVSSHPASMYGPSWAPDGSHILFTIETAEQSDVYSIRPDGTGRTNLTSREGYDGNASYSPEGETIVFVSTREALADGHAGRDLWLMDADGSNVRPLTRNQMYEGAPRFSPDGEWVAFCRQIPLEDGSQDGEIFLIDRLGSQEVRVTREPGFDCLPDWSPDGRMLTFHRCREDGCFIVVADSDGSHPRRVTDDEFGGQWPRWSPDGEWIAYTSERNGQTDIWVVRPDGSETRQVTHSPGRDEVAAWNPAATVREPF